MTPSSNHWSPKVITCCVAVVVLIITGYLVTSYRCWKKEKGSQQNKEYLMYTVRFSCFKRLVPPSFCRNQRGSGFQTVETSDLERQDNGVIRNGRDPHGSGESDQYTLESDNSGDTAAPKTNAPFDHRPVNGFSNMRDDPGGNNGTNGREMKKTEQLENGGTAAHLQAEEKSLLPDQRAADGGLEMEGEAVALVNKLSSNQDRVNRGSDALFIDVESTSPEKPANEI
ncbi:PREDICTED: uncharacterized protein LOC107093399 [Cyprinodon variegatus]|uniref:uncharacterized protein LOC107093399 n=1 Tax=Cyprinodon variegatus TaxID=28743 RepID=UPI000742CC8B|nr:PREDICTED: uncharacterized protein LOC107093399 [Cyprinodon variegatus]